MLDSLRNWGEYRPKVGHKDCKEKIHNNFSKTGAF